MRLLDEIVGDTVMIARRFHGERPGLRDIIATASYDGPQVLMLSRLRDVARRRRVPVLGTVVRRVQTALFGIEISRDVHLGEGVLFLHTVGVVIGGDSRIGDRVVFYGGSTIGRVNDSGYPRIGNDVTIGAGARILGSVTIGDGASIGANAVVLCDVPAGATAAGVPATVRHRLHRPVAQAAGER
jgi:serine O-acetyltransferase